MKGNARDPWPDRSDPVAHLRWRCDMLVKSGEILVVVLPDESRATILRNIARRMRASYLICEPTRSTKQLLQFLARGLGLNPPRDTVDLWEKVGEAVARCPWVVFLDHAEHLTRGGLDVVLDLHKHSDPRGGTVAFVLASGQRQLLERIDAIDVEGSFTSYCSYYIPGCEPTKKMEERFEAARAAHDPHPIPFAPIHAAKSEPDT